MFHADAVFLFYFDRIGSLFLVSATAIPENILCPRVRESGCGSYWALPPLGSSAKILGCEPLTTRAYSSDDFLDGFRTITRFCFREGHRKIVQKAWLNCKNQNLSFFTTLKIIKSLLTHYCDKWENHVISHMINVIKVFEMSSFCPPTGLVRGSHWRNPLWYGRFYIDQIREVPWNTCTPKNMWMKYLSCLIWGISLYHP